MAPKFQLPIYAENTPGPALDVTLQVVFDVTGAIYQVPGFIVPPGAYVTLYPSSVKGLNANPTYVATQKENVRTSAGDTLPAGQNVSLPLAIDNTGNIWVSGTAGDGVTVKIQQVQIG